MSDFDEKMIQKLKRLEREVERLQRWESPGIWKAWTPTIAWGGGTTDPTTVSVASARYCQIGKLVTVNLTIQIVTLGSGDRTYFTATAPVNVYKSSPAAIYRDGIKTGNGRAFSSDDKIYVYLSGGALAAGYIQVSVTYEEE